MDSHAWQSGLSYVLVPSGEAGCAPRFVCGGVRGLDPTGSPYPVFNGGFGALQALTALAQHSEHLDRRNTHEA